MSKATTKAAIVYIVPQLAGIAATAVVGGVAGAVLASDDDSVSPVVKAGFVVATIAAGLAAGIYTTKRLM